MAIRMGERVPAVLTITVIDCRRRSSVVSTAVVGLAATSLPTARFASPLGANNKPEARHHRSYPLRTSG